MHKGSEREGRRKSERGEREKRNTRICLDIY